MDDLQCIWQHNEVNKPIQSKQFLFCQTVLQLFIGNEKIVRLLLQNGIDINQKRKQGGWTALHDATDHGECPNLNKFE